MFYICSALVTLIMGPVVGDFVHNMISFRSDIDKFVQLTQIEDYEGRQLRGGHHH
jgi:hypothetical protein